MTPALQRGSTIVAELMNRRLIVVTGKGGVGKTTLAAVLGRLAAASGRKTLVLEVDPRESLHQLLGEAPSGGHVLPAGPRLWFQNLQPKAVLERLVRERIPIAALAARVTRSPIFAQFTEGAPGLKEMAVLGYALQVTQGKAGRRRDLVILDAPATGHAASMLEAPLLVSEVLPTGPLGDLANELAEFIADPSECAAIVAALAEEMPVQETIELIDELRRRLGRAPAGIVINGVYPPFPLARIGGDPDRRAALTLWRDRRKLNEREMLRLREAWDGSLVELPLVAIERGPGLVDALAGVLGDGAGAKVGA